MILELNSFLTEKKGGVTVRFFPELFKSSSPIKASDFLVNFKPRILNAMNQDLTRKISEIEIRDATFSIIVRKLQGLMD